MGVPKLVHFIEISVETKPHGIIISDLKQFVKSLDFSHSQSLNEMYAQISWELIENELKKQSNLEVHRVYTDEAAQVYRTFRIKTNENSDNAEEDINDDPMYKLIHDAQTKGILATQLFESLSISSKEGSKRIKELCASSDVISDSIDNTKTKRLFT